MKKIILFLLMFILMGCSTKYELVIDNETITETLEIISEESDITKKEENYYTYLEEYPIFIDEEFLYDTPNEKLENVDYYQKSIIETQFGYEATYKSKFEYNDLERSRILNTAFSTSNIGYDRKENFYYINLQNLKIFKYNKDISKIEVNIKLKDYSVIESNATYINDDYLTWVFINDENYKDNKIILNFKKKELINNGNNNTTNNNEKNDNNTIIDNNIEKKVTLTRDVLIAIAGVGVFLVIITIIFKSKKIINKNWYSKNL